MAGLFTKMSEVLALNEEPQGIPPKNNGELNIGAFRVFEQFGNYKWSAFIGLKGFNNSDEFEVSAVTIQATSVVILPDGKSLAFARMIFDYTCEGCHLETVLINRADTADLSQRRGEKIFEENDPKALINELLVNLNGRAPTTVRSLAKKLRTTPQNLQDALVDIFYNALRHPNTASVSYGSDFDRSKPDQADEHTNNPLETQTFTLERDNGIEALGLGNVGDRQAG